MEGGSSARRKDLCGRCMSRSLGPVCGFSRYQPPILPRKILDPFLREATVEEDLAAGARAAGSGSVVALALSSLECRVQIP